MLHSGWPFSSSILHTHAEPSDQLSSNSLGLEKQNLDEQRPAHEDLFIDPFQTYCALSGGTDCAKIGKESCTCYCHSALSTGHG